MRRHQFHRYTLAASCLFVLATQSESSAHAAPAPDAPAPVAQVEQSRHVALPDMVAVVDPGFGAAVQSDRLDAQRGGTDTVNNNMQLDGSVRDNVAHNVVTGSNTIDAGSFANVSGIPTVIQNSGANVLIQNATIINLQLK